jgi:solute:Na+ symporter, SSS family
MRYLDLGIILVYLAGITWFGARFRGRQKTLRDYFLGGRSAPWWAISLSIVSAETSTLTIISTPALAIAGNMAFLQLVLGYLLARILISVVFLPHYFRGEMYTAYELMRRRFGERIRRLTASIFLVTRALAEGVRVAAIALVISVVLGVGQTAAIVIIVALTLFYTFEGGMTAVIWTDVIQMTLYVTGALASFILILHQIPGGWEHLAASASSAGKFTMFDFRFSPTLEFFTRKYSFWAGILGGCFLTTASHGTDQLMVQRLLSARDERQSRLALLSSWAVIFFQFTLFLLIGLALWTHYRDAGIAPPAKLDRAYPQFLWNELPAGAAGLAVAAILAAAMANLSAALNSLASTTVIDFFSPEKRSLKLARIATVAWAFVMLPVAVRASQSQSVLETGLTIASIPSGVLLGVFLLGVLTKRPGERAAMAGVVTGLCAILYVWLRTPVAYTWYVLVGTVATFAGAMLASLFERAPEEPAEEVLTRQPVGGRPHLPSRRETAEEE